MVPSQSECRPWADGHDDKAEKNGRSQQVQAAQQIFFAELPAQNP
jgi:hypothetical protein